MTEAPTSHIPVAKFYISGNQDPSVAGPRAREVLDKLQVCLMEHVLPEVFPRKVVKRCWKIDKDNLLHFREWKKRFEILASRKAAAPNPSKTNNMEETRAMCVRITE